MELLTWLFSHWWISILVYVLAFGICVAFAFRSALRGYRAERDADTGTGADAGADTDTGAEFIPGLYTRGHGDPECREHLARFAGGATGPRAILRPCGCPYIGPPFDDCPDFRADEKALR